RALVDNEQGYIVLTHLARDGTKNGLGSHLTVEQFVSFFHHDHQGARLDLVFSTVIILGGLLPGVADLASDQVGDKQVVELVIVFAKREHNMALILKSGDNRIQPVAGRRIGKVGTVEK